MHVLPNNVTNSLKSDHMANLAEAKIEEVTVTTIDSFTEKHGINSIDVLKTDTEGFDVEVFRGAARMLKTSAVSYVLVEVGFRSGDLLHTSMTQVNTILNDYGFQVGGFYDTGNLASTHADGYCNALYYHREKVK